MGGIADELLTTKVDDEVQVFEGYLAHQCRRAIGDFHDIRGTISALNRQTNGTVEIDIAGVGNAPHPLGVFTLQA